MDITLKLVRELVQQQFQKWAHLPLKPVACQGHDHRTFHLGNDLLLRLPSAPIYAAQIEKEYHWLPFLASHICVDIPRPVAMGQATEAYPLPWGVYTWLPGTSANQMPVEQVDHHLLAMDLARFLRELWAIDASQGPRPGQHNFWRGSHLGVYEAEVRECLDSLGHVLDVARAKLLWQAALNTSWHQTSLWVHGDFASGNILLHHGRLAAVIDFGCVAVGDPACDLVIAWTLLSREARELFKNHVHMDQGTWTRARGWALWKAMLCLRRLEGFSSKEAQSHKRVIEAVLSERLD